jgi:hypothetical protein
MKFVDAAGFTPFLLLEQIDIVASKGSAQRTFSAVTD